MEFLRKYNTATHIYIPIVKRAVVDFAVGADWTPAAGDVKISKDGGASANVTNLPTAIAMGNTAMWDFSLTATELSAAKIVVMVADSATKAVEDQSFLIATYGNASAEHAVDLDDAADLGVTALTGHTPQSGDSFARLGAPAGASVSADIAAIEAQTDDIGAAGAGLTAITAKTDNLPADPADQSLIIAATDAVMARLGAPAGASVSADIAAIEAQTDDIGIAGAGLTALGDARLANLNATVASRAVPGDAMALTGAAVDAIADEVYEGTITLREAIRIILAAAAGKADGFPGGPVHYRDQADTKDRITATVAAGNRTAVTVDGT